jgi:YggT family protein
MFVAGNLLEGLAHVLDWVLTLYMWVVIIRALISWVNPDPWNPIVQTLNRLTEPVLEPIRRRVFRTMGYGIGLDLSPIIVILIIVFLQYALVQSLFQMASRMR